MKKILEFFGTKVFKQIGDVVDELFTSDEERIRAKNEIFKVLQEKELELQKMQTEIIVAEAKGNWLHPAAARVPRPRCSSPRPPRRPGRRSPCS